MYFDWLTLAAVADELRTTILDGRVQRVLLPNQHSVGLEIYAQRRRSYLLASAHPQFARVHLVSQRPSRGVEQATPLLLLLRKYVLGGRIVAIEQPPLERILSLSIVKDSAHGNHADTVPDDEDETRPPDETGEALRSEFIIETMERRSNIMLVDDTNIILESVKRVPAHVSQRVILPHQPYEVPPRQDKRDPRSVTADGIAALRSLEQPDLVRALVKGYQGVSPQAAREIVSRALGRTDARIDEDVPWDTLAACMRELFTDAPEPTLVPGDEQPRAYAPYRLTHIAGAQPQPGMSAALEAFYAARETLTDHRQRRDAVQQQLDATRQRLQQQLTQMQRELEHVENVDYLRWEGEMIFAFLHTLEPGQTTLDVEGHTITLDPEHSPVENAQARFQTYQRAHSGRESLHERLRETRARLDGLEQLAALLAMSDEREQIDQLAQEAEEQGYIKPAGKPGKKKRAVRRKPLHLVSSDGIDVYVGRSSAQNEDVTFRIGRPDDVWLHVRTIPGAHVIVRSSGDDVPERTLAEAAGLAAYFSPSRHEAAVDVDMARRSRVRRVPGGTPGLVTYRAERTLHVPPLPPWS